VAELLLVVNLCSAGAMTGLIWFVQVVHYPMLGRFPVEGTAAANRDHQRRTSWVVGPPLAVEGVVALALLVAPPDAAAAGDTVLLWVAAGLLGVALASTVLLQVPMHGRLAHGPDDAAAHRLVRTNWIRTAAWSARLALLATVTTRVVG
jgi:hypothetical protein